MILVITALVTMGCSTEETEVTTTLPETEAVNMQDGGDTRTGGDRPGLETSSTAEEGTIDPVLKDYIYPNSELDGDYAMGKTVSYFFKSPDDFAKVVEYYQKKFPGSPPQSGENAYYNKKDSDGSATVTVTKTDNTTQIILRRDKK